MASVPDKNKLLARYQRQCVLEHGQIVISLPLMVLGNEIRAAEELIAAHVHAVGEACGEPTTYDIVDSDNGYYLQVLTLGPPPLVLHTLVAHMFGLSQYIDRDLNWESAAFDDVHTGSPVEVSSEPLWNNYILRQLGETITAGDIEQVNGHWMVVHGDLLGEQVTEEMEVARNNALVIDPTYKATFRMDDPNGAVPPGKYRIMQPGETVVAECIMRTDEGWRIVDDVHISRKVEHGEQYGIPTQ